MDAVERFSEAGDAKKPSMPAVSQKNAKKSAKPAWAMTQKQTEEQKDAEVDDLLEFAYELDYEKYMEDYDVRQAIAVIKERVGALNTDWKQDMVDEWNAADASNGEGKYETAS